jgi:hypothetical protein
MKFEQNIGKLDRILRIGISSALIYISLIDTAFIADPLSSGILALIGLVNMFVAMAGFCPLYTVTGINTRKLS